MALDPVIDTSTGATPYDVIVMTLAAGEIRYVPGVLRYISLLTATAPTQVSISFNGASFFAFSDGVSISGFYGTGFWARNDSGSSNTLTFARGQGEFRDNRIILSALSSLPVASTIADGADVTQGARADAAATTDTGTFTLVALFKRLLSKFYDRASSVYTVNAAATTNAASIKATPGAVLSVSVINASAATKYVRLYDKASAPTVGTDVAYRVIAVPATSSKEIAFPGGDNYANGIAIAITAAAAYNDATAVAANDVQLSVNYQ